MLENAAIDSILSLMSPAFLLLIDKIYLAKKIIECVSEKKSLKFRDDTRKINFFGHVLAIPNDIVKDFS